MEINLNKQQQEEEKQKESPVETVLVLQGGGSLGTITGKLTWSMWVDVFNRARSLIVNK